MLIDFHISMFLQIVILSVLNLHHMIVVGGTMNGNHVVWVMMDDLAQLENVLDLVVFSVERVEGKTCFVLYVNFNF